MRKLKLEKILIYLRNRLRGNDFGVPPVRCNAVMEL